jgi:hypothetical protein
MLQYLFGLWHYGKNKGARYAIPEEAKLTGLRGKRSGVLGESRCIKNRAVLKGETRKDAAGLRTGREHFEHCPKRADRSSGGGAMRG